GLVAGGALCCGLSVVCACIERGATRERIRSGYARYPRLLLQCMYGDASTTLLLRTRERALSIKAPRARFIPFSLARRPLKKLRRCSSRQSRRLFSSVEP